MIQNIIFDFGGVFINLDMDAVNRGLNSYGLVAPGADLLSLSAQYEKGEVDSKTFLRRVQQSIPGSQEEGIRQIWNATIADFPFARLEFLIKLKESGRYRMFLLSNTNALHIEQVRDNMGKDNFDRFRGCFEAFYLSHEIGMRKPDPKIFSFVLDKNGLRPEETLFIDDTKEHIESASALGINTWHLDVQKESILELNKHLV
ncbi:HAD family hydrolase [Robiginitalea sp.]|uniref:HAD family hydrolase n=1 Tax=Robiginitalea sp. TaxID=1902411 RepID=UPI003C363050